ncbi:hypothetical protein BC567DRAFT_7938 [Phyllosticta citribraziliensis]
MGLWPNKHTHVCNTQLRKLAGGHEFIWKGEKRARRSAPINHVSIRGEFILRFVSLRFEAKTRVEQWERELKAAAACMRAFLLARLDCQLLLCLNNLSACWFSHSLRFFVPPSLCPACLRVFPFLYDRLSARTDRPLRHLAADLLACLAASEVAVEHFVKRTADPRSRRVKPRRKKKKKKR